MKVPGVRIQVLLLCICSHLTWMFLIGFGTLNFVYGCAFCCCFVLGIVSCHILYMRPAKSHSWKSLLGQYKYLLTRVNQAERRYNRFVEASKQCAVSQEKVLRGILDHAKNTEHGLRYRFGEISTRDKFTREHPLTSYDFYRDYARRSIDEGEENLTVPDPILYFGITSGSSGKNKIYSLTDRGRLFRTDLLWFHTVKRHCLMNLGRHFYIKYASKSVRSKFGLPMGPASVFEYLVPIELSPVPNEVYYIDDEHVSLYVFALFCLLEPELTSIDAMMAPLAYGFWHTIKLKWPQICADIETGKLSIRAPDPAHSTIAAHLTANPQRAAFLRKHFNVGLTGIAKRIWPRLKVFFMVGSGPLSAFANILKQEELTGVDVCNVTHISTETIMGSAVAYQGDRYVLCIDHTFFEFIPDTDMHSETPKTVLFADQLEVNKCYEIVVTTHSGLYRYRMGDVIKVVGFFNEKTPIYEFMYRSGQMLQVAAEKTPENTFLEAIVKTEKQLQYELGDMKFINYTACENFYIQKLRKNKLDDGRHYVLFLEIEGKNLTEIQKALFDENLCSLFERYEQLRHAGSITAMEIIPVKSGTFDKLRDLISSQRFNPQYKIPRVQRREEPLRILLDNIA